MKTGSQNFFAKPAVLVVIIVVLLGLCLAVCGVALVFTGAADQILAMLGMTKANAAALAPAQAPIFIALNVDVQQIQNYSKVAGIYAKIPQVQDRIKDSIKQGTGSSECNFDQDFVPWWGPEAAVFFTDLKGLNTRTTSTPRGTSPTGNLVFALGTRDLAKSDAAIRKCFARQNVTEETYKGYKVLLSSNGATTTVKNFVLVGTTADALHAAIDAATTGGAATLAQNATYKRVLRKLPSSRFGTMYFDVAPIFKEMANQPGFQPQLLTQLEAYQGMAASLAFTEDGLRIDMVVDYDSNKLKDCAKQLLQKLPSSNQVLKELPANTFLSASSANFKETWDCSLSQYDETSRRQFEDSMASMKKQTGIDVNEDVLSWMTGEFALALIPSKPLTSSFPGIGVLALFEAKDQALIAGKLTRITSAFQTSGAQFKDQQVEGVTMHVASTGSPRDTTAPVIGYGFPRNYLVIGLPLDALFTSVGASKNSLGEDATFKHVQSVLPQKNNGYVYANLAGIEGLYSDSLRGRELDNYRRDVQPWLKPLKAIGIASENASSDLTIATIFLHIRGD